MFPLLPKVAEEFEFSGSPVASRASSSQHVLNKCAFPVNEWHFSLKKKMNYTKNCGACTVWGLCSLDNGS